MRSVAQYLAIISGFVAPTLELVMRICTMLFFDPLPTIVHSVAFYLMPISMLVAKYILSKPYTERRNRLAMFCVSYGLIVSAAYSIWFIPISWISIIAILFVGLGLLGLTPFFLFVASLSIYRSWKKWAPAEKVEMYNHRVTRSVLLVIPALVVLWWHPAIIKIGESLLKSENVSTKYIGLTVLNYLTSDDELQWRSFDVNTRYFGAEVFDSELLRDAFYYIYGTRPGIAKKGNGFLGAAEWEFDRERGASSVGKRQEGLSLAESAIDGVVETSDGYGYYEWTMVFDNSSFRSKEARAAVQLPTYSVVSKVSLWVDGEEREAAFGAASHVKSVYQGIVAQKRDPLLVTMIGPDQIQLQCFPVPSEGSMKIRIGITCPLLGGTKLQLPRFMESNFDIPDNLNHNVWIESDAPAIAIVAGVSQVDSSITLVISNSQLSRADTYFEYDVELVNKYEFSDGALSLERLKTSTAEIKPVLLIDGRDDVFDAVEGFKWVTDSYSAVIVAHPFGFEVWHGGESLTSFMSSQSTHGGVNPSSAIVEALRIATAKSVPVVWLHGSLPPAVRDELALEQIIRRSDEPVEVTTLSVSAELNSFVSDLTYMRYFRPYPTTGNTAKDLVDAVRSTSQKSLISARQVPLGGRTASGYAFESSDSMDVSHPYRLFLYSRIMKSWYDTGKVSDDLTALALETRIVTPTTGAVVLETQSQYKRANLDPSMGSENIPKIPEPEFYILLALSLLVLTIYFRKKRSLACGLSR